ncbi:MAG TPA: protein kinase, partial [Gemmatimonadaceae bacterium]|nr:protein kinase [Gemmatimonadaceae bacterium]
MPTSDLLPRLQAAVGDAYVVERELAPGGMSRLVLATERALDRQVVIKLLPPELANENTAQRFQREMLITASLQHTHILPVLSAGVQGELLYYVTPFVAGETLRHRLASGGALAIDETVRLLRQVADALAFAHERGVVHRDLKPENILLQHGHAILADFGIARALERATRVATDERLTATGLGLGTPGYMAPEQLAAEPDVDARADIYAVGAIAYEMLAGHPPFPGRSPALLLVAHLTEAPEPVTTCRADVPARLALLVMRCLEKDPASRWQTAAELMGELEERVLLADALSRAPSDAERPPAIAEPAGTPTVADPLRAGLQAFERCEWSEAYAALANANTRGELSPPHLERLAEAAWWVGRGDDCITTRELAYERYLESGDPRRAAAVALAVAEDHFHKLARSVAQAWLQRAERHLRELPESIEHGWLARTNAMLAFEDGRDLGRAGALAEEAFEIARRMNDRDLQTLALQDRGRILVAQGRLAEGMALIDEAMVAATSGQLGPRTTGRTYCNMMSTCGKLADYRRAGEWSEEARRWSTRHTESGFPGICRVHRAELLRLRGAWPEAELEARRASTELEHFLDDIAAEAYYELGEIRLRMGDLEAADALFRRAHGLGRDPLPGLALLRLAQDRIESARALLERALSDSVLTPLDRTRLLPARAEVALAAGALETARAAAEELGTIATVYATPALAAGAAFARGLMELGEGIPPTPPPVCAARGSCGRRAICRTRPRVRECISDRRTSLWAMGRMRSSSSRRRRRPSRAS